MAKPSSYDVHVDAPLTNMAVNYMQNAANFGADRIAPRCPVQKQSDKYFIYTKADWLRAEAKRRAPGAESAGGGYGVSTTTYSCDVFAIHKDIDAQVRANTDSPLDADRDAVNYVTQQLMLVREYEVAAKVFVASTWVGSSTAADITVGTQWNDAASTPIEDVRAQQIAMAEKTGRKANVMVVGPEVYSKLLDHPDVLDRIKYTQRGIASAELLAQLFDVDALIVPFATRNTAAEGATASYDYYWGKNCWIGHVTSAPSITEPSALYTFLWTGYAGANAFGIMVDSFYLPALKVDRVEGEQAFVVKQVATDLGVYFTSVVA